MKRKNKIRWFLYGLSLFIVLLLLESVNWFAVKFENLDLSVAVYQMLSPLKGTSTSVLTEFCRESLLPAIIWTVIVLACFGYYEFVTQRIYFCIVVNFLSN